MTKSIRHLTLIGGCILLLAVTIASCSSAVKEPATLGNAIGKVLVHGKSKENANQKTITFRSGMFQYCVIVDTKKSILTTAKASLFNIGLESWSVDTRTGELTAFLNKDGMYERDEWKYWDTLGKPIPEVNKLRRHFEDAQKDVVKLICEKFWPPTGFLLWDWSLYLSHKESLVGFFY